MATRIYLPSSGNAAVTPGSWIFPNQINPLTFAGVLTKGTTAMTTRLQATGTANPTTRAMLRYVVGPLGTQNIGGTVKLQMRAMESATGANATFAIATKIIKPDGTDRATLLGVSAADSATSPYEFLTTLTNRRVYNSAEVQPIPLSAQDAQAGDYLVIEIGFRSATTTSRNISLRYGDNSASDLPDDTTSTADYAPYVEFSQDLVIWQEDTSKRTRSTKTFRYIVTGKRRWEQIGKTALHYDSVLDSGACDAEVNCTATYINDANFDGWAVEQNGWHYRVGQPKIGLFQGLDGVVGYGGRKGQHWFKFRLAKIGYGKASTMEWGDIGGAPTYNRANLGNTTETITHSDGHTQVVSTTTTWADIWPEIPNGQIDVRWRVEGRGLKEEIVLNQAARDDIATNRPPSYFFPGTPLNDLYFGFAFRLDWSDIPKVYRKDILQSIEETFADDGEKIEVKDAVDRLLAFIPLDNLHVAGAEIDDNGIAPLRKRFYKDGSDYFLLVGVRCDLLPDLAVGDLIFDPTFTDGYGGDVTTYIETRLVQSSADTNYGTSTTIRIMNSSNVGLYKFDLSSITDGVTVDSAYLYLTNEDQKTDSQTLYIRTIKAANSAWTEADATWNYAVATTTRWEGDAADNGGTDAGCSVSGTDYDATEIGTISYVGNTAGNTEHQSTDLDATAIGNWIAGTNYGVRINSSRDDTMDWYTSDHATTGYRPKLVVEYTEGGEEYTQSVSGAITPAGTVVNRAGKIVSGALTSSGGLVNSARKVLAGGLTSSGVLVNSARKVLAGAITPAGVVAAVKTALVSLAGELTSAGVLVRQTGKSLAGALTPDGGLVRSARKVLAGSVTPDGALAKMVGKILAGSLTPSGIVATVKAALISLAGELTSAGALVIRTGKSLAGELTSSGVIVRSVGKVLAGELTSIGDVLKRTAKTFAGELTSAGDLIASKLTGTVYYQAIAGALEPAGDLVSLFVAAVTRHWRPKPNRTGYDRHLDRIANYYNTLRGKRK